MTKETRSFQAEVKQILDLMVHSLYSHREIFLRELVSNASDALDKLRFEELQNPEWDSTQPHVEKHIRLIPNTEARTLTIVDNGIGMTHDEVISNIGTIARSGTKEFLKHTKELKDRPELIGQFGVGFYASFMVADKVTVHTQKAGTHEGTLWESIGDGSFTIDRVVRPEGVGTTITLHLKDFEGDESAEDFTDEFVIRRVVKKYSDFIAWPIRMLTSREEPEVDAEGKEIEGQFKKVEDDETLNSQKAIWLRSPSEVSEEDYQEFYRHVAHDWAQPFDRIHYRAEGSQEFTALLFIPGAVPQDYFYRETKWGLSLYINRVFIMDHAEELLPPWLRFLRGIIDSSDLSLNVSREILQKDRQVQSIKKALTNKVLKHLEAMLKNDRPKFETFWKNFGSTLKEGLANDFAHKEKIQELALFQSSGVESYTSLKEYVERMSKDQKEIYFITGDNLEQLKASPYTEKVKQKGYEILYCTDPVDEWVMQSINRFDDKMLRSITKEGLDLDSEEEKASKEQEVKEKEVEFKDLIRTIQGAVSEKVKEVKISKRLVDSPVVLVSGAYDSSARLERMMESMGQAMPKAKRIMEINPTHAVFGRMKSLSEEQQKEWAEILYNQALLAEGSPLDDPMKFSQQISKLMSEPL
ncbi:MAG: molecular chaperone HtpG [Proteobacteria bacterium]|nr:MAG: molecular chaperone HtpG [Pseudomonadota bacterium]